MANMLLGVLILGKQYELHCYVYIGYLIMNITVVVIVKLVLTVAIHHSTYCFP